MPQLGSFIIAHDTMHMQYTRLGTLQYIRRDLVCRICISLSQKKGGIIIQTLSVQTNFMYTLLFCSVCDFFLDLFKVLYNCFATVLSSGFVASDVVGDVLVVDQRHLDLLALLPLPLGTN